MAAAAAPSVARGRAKPSELLPERRRGAAEDGAQLSASDDFNSCRILVRLLWGFVLEVHGGVSERLRDAQLRSRSEQSMLEFQTFTSRRFLDLGYYMATTFKSLKCKPEAE